MQFLIDAHLPMRLVRWLLGRGHEVIHTRDLPEANETEDLFIIRNYLAPQGLLADSGPPILFAKA